MDLIIGLVLIALLFGSLSSLLAHSKVPTRSTAITFFVVGALFSALGLLLAALVKRAETPLAVGWYPLAENSTSWRYWDGTNWGPLHQFDYESQKA